ncbi:CCA tRNA nucleotidyltransferase [Ligilactobacillus apodemi]|uniref:CCA tRNA nucleotidyltransferase n=1 Tax=Ligilactobacillus apodemi TaxID=307126 RepID=UPI00214AD31B|nr:CCA tRNA nucleotidyltransferase [Ligilactobacillus apodemi]MCR1900696.1 CCA tRNA nucleotidyltransferase [Ligilactobacillus apodemi]
MQVKNLPQEFIETLPVLEQIRQAGFEAYFVGGSVRDTLLGLPIHDVDIATSAYPAEIKDIFERTVDTGIEHGTVMVLDHGNGYEITTFRTESGYQDFRRPDKVEFVRSLKEDLKRRDLTINALALAPDGTVIDLFSGITDLENKVLRAVGQPEERFFEDALRMMRTVRFASQLGFSIETDTFAAIAKNAHLLEKIAVERIHVEWVKLLLGQDLKQGVTVFLKTELYRYCPGLAQQKENLAKLLELDEFQLADELACWSLLCYLCDFSISDAKKFLKSWKTSNEIITEVTNVLTLLKHADEPTIDPFSCYKAKEKATQTAADLAEILQLKLSKETLITTYEQLPIKDKAQLTINGKVLIEKLSLKPGPILGKVLNILEHEVVLGNLPNQPEVLLQRAQELSKD